MNIRRKSRPGAEISASSLTDIMFFLMLFFLITSTLVSPNVIKLLLPNAVSGKSIAKKNVTLSVNEELSYFIDNKPVLYSNIESKLQEVTFGTESTIILKVDQTVPVQNLVDLLDIGNRLKIKMVLATQLPKN